MEISPVPAEPAARERVAAVREAVGEKVRIGVPGDAEGALERSARPQGCGTRSPRAAAASA